MGYLTYIKGDLFQTQQPIICHSVNCCGGFGSGVAGQIAKLYPEVRKAYLRKHRTLGWCLGETQFVGDNPTIVNMATQLNYGRDGRLYTDYNAVKTCLTTVFSYAEDLGQGVAMPLIGCGLGGGKWPIVVGIIRDMLTIYGVEVAVYII